MDRRQQTAAAAERYREMARDRKELKRRQKAEGSQVVDTPERVRARAARLARAGQLQPEALVAAMVPGEQVEPHVLLERIIAATNDLQAVNFLTRGARAARTVARISYDRRGRLVPAGTGLLVGQRLLLTNNHVLPDVTTAEQAAAEFNWEIDLDDVTGTIATYRLDPQALFLTDEHLDYTLVAVQAGPDGSAPGQVFGWNRLIAQQGKIATGEPVNVVGHPMGRLKEIAIRNNSLQTVLEEFLHYETDTEPGNSGSPVFNDQWEIVALHHSGVPNTDEEGNWLKPDGTRWRPQDGDDAVHWIANEGARVSVLLGHMANRQLSDRERAVLAELGPHALPAEPTAVAPVAPVDAAVVETPAQPEGVAVAVGRAGLAGRQAPFDGNTQLVFLHGRSQQGKDPQLLRGKWTAGLAKGLALAGLPAVDAADVWFPFYGDTFADSLAAREALALDPLDAEADPAEALAPGMPPPERCMRRCSRGGRGRWPASRGGDRGRVPRRAGRQAAEAAELAGQPQRPGRGADCGGVPGRGRLPRPGRDPPAGPGHRAPEHSHLGTGRAGQPQPRHRGRDGPADPPSQRGRGGPTGDRR
jgi:endonuclease G, mitochondrial